MSQRLRLTILLFATALAGCGGGDKETTKPPVVVNASDDRAVAVAYESIAEGIAELEGVEEARVAAEELGIPGSSAESEQATKEALDAQINAVVTALQDEPPVAKVPSQANQTVLAVLREIEGRVRKVYREGSQPLTTARTALKADATGGPSAETVQQAEEQTAAGTPELVADQRSNLTDAGYDVDESEAGGEPPSKAELIASRDGLILRVIAYATASDAKLFSEDFAATEHAPGTVQSELRDKIFYWIKRDDDGKLPPGAIDKAVSEAEGS